MKRITSFVTSLALALTQIIMPMPFTPNAYAVMDIGVDQSLAILSVLDVTPGTALEFQGPKGGPFQPTGSDYYTLKNSGDLPLNWTANDSLGWADLTPSQGTLAPAESIMVTVSINKTANGLTFSQSSFSNDVYFTNLSTSQSVVRQVILSTGSMAMAMAAAVPNFWIGSALISFRVLLLLPQTDCDCFFSVRGEERDFIFEALLLPKEGNDFLLNRQSKLRNAIRLQLHANSTSKHVNPLGS